LIRKKLCAALRREKKRTGESTRGGHRPESVFIVCREERVAAFLEEGSLLRSVCPRSLVQQERRSPGLDA